MWGQNLYHVVWWYMTCTIKQVIFCMYFSKRHCNVLMVSKSPWWQDHVQSNLWQEDYKWQVDRQFLLLPFHCDHLPTSSGHSLLHFLYFCKNQTTKGGSHQFNLCLYTTRMVHQKITFWHSYFNCLHILLFQHLYLNNRTNIKHQLFQIELPISLINFMHLNGNGLTCEHHTMDKKINWPRWSSYFFHMSNEAFLKDFMINRQSH